MGNNGVINIPEPKISRLLFADTRSAWLWLILRVYLGWEWVHAGWTKLLDPGWIGANAGTSLVAFLNNAEQCSKACGAAVATSWYWYFINNVALPHSILFSFLVTYGELLVGACLVIGAFTGIVATFGVFLNFNYLLAGIVSVNPLFIVVELLLILAWRNAGWYGADHYLLPGLGTPWYPGTLFKRASQEE